MMNDEDREYQLDFPFDEFRAEFEADGAFDVEEHRRLREALSASPMIRNSVHRPGEFSFEIDCAAFGAALKIISPPTPATGAADTTFDIIFSSSHVRLTSRFEGISLSLMRGITWREPPKKFLALRFTDLQEVEGLRTIMNISRRLAFCDYLFDDKKLKIAIPITDAQTKTVHDRSTFIINSVVLEDSPALPKLTTELGPVDVAKFRRAIKFVRVSSQKVYHQTEYGGHATYDINAVVWLNKSIFCRNKSLITIATLDQDINFCLAINSRYCRYIYRFLRPVVSDAAKLYVNDNTLIISDGLLYVECEREKTDEGRHANGRWLKALKKASQSATGIFQGDGPELHYTFSMISLLAGRKLLDAFANIAVECRGDKLVSTWTTGWALPQKKDVRSEATAVLPVEEPWQFPWAVWVDQSNLRLVFQVLDKAPIKIGYVGTPPMLWFEQEQDGLVVNAIILGVEPPPVISKFETDFTDPPSDSAAPSETVLLSPPTGQTETP